jgi:hypothetical protein
MCPCHVVEKWWGFFMMVWFLINWLGLTDTTRLKMVIHQAVVVGFVGLAGDT